MYSSSLECKNQSLYPPTVKVSHILAASKFPGVFEEQFELTISIVFWAPVPITNPFDP